MYVALVLNYLISASSNSISVPVCVINFVQTSLFSFPVGDSGTAYYVGHYSLEPRYSIHPTYLRGSDASYICVYQLEPFATIHFD